MDFKRAGKDADALALTQSGETMMAEIRSMLTSFEKNELNLYELRASAAAKQRIYRTSALALLASTASSKNGLRCPSSKAPKRTSAPSLRTFAMV